MTRSANAVSLMAALLTAAGTAPHYLFVDPNGEAAKELIDAGLAVTNAEIVNPKNKKEVAMKLSDAGTAEANKPTTDTATSTLTTASTFKIVDFELPKIERKGGGGGGNRKSKYPTEQLQPGQAFFIPVGDDVKSPSKTYGSIASAANKKFGDLKAGADFRFFETRAIADGAPFGDEYKGKRGIAIGRLSAAAALAKRDDLIANPPKPRKPRTPKVAPAA
jgi:hypothetical protein